jgi:hypothetical protein
LLRTSIKDNNIACSALFKDTGTYQVYLKVFDGVHYSLEDTVIFRVHNRPTFFVNWTNLHTSYQHYPGKRKFVYSNGISIICSNYKTLTKNDVIVYHNTFPIDTFKIRKGYYQQAQKARWFWQGDSSLSDLLKGDEKYNEPEIIITDEGFYLALGFDAGKDFKRTYQIAVKDKNINSDTTNITFSHLSFRWTCLNLGFQHTFVTLVEEGNALHRLKLKSQEIRIGGFFHLLPITKDNSLSLDAEFSFGFALNNENVKYRINYPLEISTSVKFQPPLVNWGMDLGIRANLVAFHEKLFQYEEPSTSLLIFPSYFAGIEGRPFNQYPITLYFSYETKLFKRNYGINEWLFVRPLNTNIGARFPL